MLWNSGSEAKVMAGPLTPRRTEMRGDAAAEGSRNLTRKRFVVSKAFIGASSALHEPVIKPMLAPQVQNAVISMTIAAARRQRF